MPRKSQKLTRRLGAGANPSTSTTSISTAGDFDYSGEFGLCTSLEDCTRKLIVTLGIDTGVFQNAQGQMTSILSGIFGKALKLLGLMLGVLVFSGLPGVENASKAVTKAARGVATRVRKAVKGIWDKAKSVGMKVFGPIFKKMRALFQKPAFVGAIATGMILLTYLKGCSARESLDKYVRSEFSTSVGNHIKTTIEGIPSLPLVGSTLNSIASLIGTLVTAVIQSSQDIVGQVVRLMQKVCSGGSSSDSSEPITDLPAPDFGGPLANNAWEQNDLVERKKPYGPFSVLICGRGNKYEAAIQVAERYMWPHTLKKGTNLNVVDMSTGEVPRKFTEDERPKVYILQNIEQDPDFKSNISKKSKNLAGGKWESVIDASAPKFGQRTYTILTSDIGSNWSTHNMSVSDIREKVYEKMNELGFRPAAIGRLQSSSGGAVLFLEN